MRIAYFDFDAVYRGVPLASGAMAAILSVMPVAVPGLAIATPAFALMTVYHWTLYRPDLLPPTGVFAIGLLVDLLNGTPYLGLSSLILLIARSLAMRQRPLVANRDFAVVWAGFLVTAAIVTALEWAVVSILNEAPLGSRPFIFQAIVTVAAFPVASYLLAWTQRALLRRV
jgi:rod shape-determining protein MreD